MARSWAAHHEFVSDLGTFYSRLLTVPVQGNSELNNLNFSDDDRVDVLREAMTMVLYLSIVLLATLAALPTGAGASGDSHGGGGVHGLDLVGLIWGTAIGLALAHWFAFRLTARAFSGGNPTRGDLYVGLSQVAAAVGMAFLCSIPVVLISDSNEVQAATVVPGVIVGVAGYFTARAGGRSKTQALIIGGIVLLAGLSVAAVKNFLLGH